MSLFSWILVSIGCIIIVVIGYAGVTGKSIFSYKDRNNKKPHH